MSRTFKTDPFWVKLQHPERTGIHPREVHDHRDGKCNLPTLDRASCIRWAGVHDCRWEWKYSGVNECGCRMCTNYWQRRWDRRRVRNHERRVTQKWLDEYEDRPEDEAQACPKGGLACTCIKLPEECPHLDWEYWDNDFGRQAIGDTLNIQPVWTLSALQVNKTKIHWN